MRYGNNVLFIFSKLQGFYLIYLNTAQRECNIMQFDTAALLFSLNIFPVGVKLQHVLCIRLSVRKVYFLTSTRLNNKVLNGIS